MTNDHEMMRPLRGAVVALGNFDGFHLGHQAVVARAMAIARAENRPAVVATFSPHPVRLFQPHLAPFLLTGIEQRMRLFRAFGADDAVAIPFDRTLAQLSPEDFVACWLKDALGAAAVVTGADFNFGRARAGDVAALKLIGARHGITAEAVPLLTAEGAPASSTRVRQCLAAGEVDAARRLLGRPHRMTGVARATTVNGRPAIAMALGDYVRPRAGRYAIQARLAGGRTMPGVAHFTGPEQTMLSLILPQPPRRIANQMIGIDLVSRFAQEGGFPVATPADDRTSAIAECAAACNL